MARRSFNLQERILESDIGKMDWNNGVGKSKAIVLDNDNLTIYVNGIKVEGEPKTFHIEDEKRGVKVRYGVGKARYGFGKMEYSCSWETEDSYPAYKLMYGNDIEASKVRFNDMMNRYYYKHCELMKLWQRRK